MTTTFLAPGQLQLLNHVTTWGNLRIAEISASPLASPPETVKGRSAVPPLLPSDRTLQYLERVRQNEGTLLTTLGLDPADLEREVARKDGPSLNAYFWSHHLPWMQGATGQQARVAADDLWQIRQARVNALERVTRWKRAFGKDEKPDSRLNVVGLENNLTWLMETYAYRHFLIQQLGRKHRPGWDLVTAFYDPAERAAQNLLDGAAALKKYLKVGSGQ